jgi:rhodanese-related sulfurtransferase
MAGEIKLLSTAEVLERWQQDPSILLLDVRTEEEWEMHHIPGATLMPMHTLRERMGELDPARETILICEHGVRSHSVAQYLATQADFVSIASMEGGMSEWTGPEEFGE